MMIRFIDKWTKKVLCEISIDGLFPGEINSTKELLAQKIGLKVEDIEVFNFGDVEDGLD